MISTKGVGQWELNFLKELPQIIIIKTISHQKVLLKVTIIFVIRLEKQAEIVQLQMAF